MNIKDVPQGVPMPMIETPYPPPEQRIIVHRLAPVVSWAADPAKGVGFSLVVTGITLDNHQEIEPIALLLSRSLPEVRKIIRTLAEAADNMERKLAT